MLVRCAWTTAWCRRSCGSVTSRTSSVAPSVYVLVRAGAELRPELAAAMRGAVLLRFGEGHAPVRIEFCGDVIDVGDDADGEDRACDLVLRGGWRTSTR